MPPFSIQEFLTAHDRPVPKRLKYPVLSKNNHAAGMFRIERAYELMHDPNLAARPAMLFGEFWYENELCILFADTNMGKSVLAVQIANSLATRRAIEPFELVPKEQNVVYLDFELSSQQFHSRYTDKRTDVPADFGRSFYRASFNLDNTRPAHFRTDEDYIRESIEYAVMATQSDVLIIDNITCLKQGTENAGAALGLMRMLKALKAKLKISVLVLAHTPKRNPALPITRNDMQGSKMLINFCDSAFAIGQSNKLPGLHYIKQVKQRNTHEVYGAANVCLCRIKKDGPHLQFEFNGYGNEYELLQKPAVDERDVLKRRVKELSAKGYSQRLIAGKLKIGYGTVNRILRAG